MFFAYFAIFDEFVDNCLHFMLELLENTSVLNLVMLEVSHKYILIN